MEIEAFILEIAKGSPSTLGLAFVCFLLFKMNDKMKDNKRLLFELKDSLEKDVTLIQSEIKLLNNSFSHHRELHEESLQVLQNQVNNIQKDLDKTKEKIEMQIDSLRKQISQ